MSRRVLYVANARLPTEKAHGHAIVKMCEGYARLGHELDLWYPSRKPRLPPTAVFQYYGVPQAFRATALPFVDLVPMEARLPRRLFLGLLAAHELSWAWYVSLRARRRGFDLHHTRNTAVALCLARAGLPTVVEVHTVPTGPRRRLLGSLADLPALRGVIALTRSGADDLVDLGLPSSKLDVLSSSVDVDAYAGLPSRAACRAAVGLPPDRQVVGYVGKFQTLGKEKGIPTLLAALAALRQEHGLRPVLVCVGGPMEAVDAYRGARGGDAGERDDVVFVDHVPSVDVPTWIAACDVGVVPFPRSVHFARYASPLKAFEFQAAGVPLVASDLPALREVLTHGNNAWLVEPDDPRALAKGLARVLTDRDLRETLSVGGQRAVANRTWVQRAARIVERFGTENGSSPGGPSTT